MMKMTWLGYAVIAVLLLMGYTGYRRGFIKEILSFFFVFLTLSLAWTIDPYVNTFLMENTPVYEKIQESCSSFVSMQDNSVEETETGSEAETDSDTGIQSDTQTSIIEGMALPEILRQNLVSNNTDSVYQYLGVDSFNTYISGYLARTIINGMSYLVSYILANLILRVLVCVLNAIAELPVIHGANRLTGGIVGIAKGILLVWVALLILTVFCSTEIGQKGLALVEEDSFLSILYKHDILVNFFMNIFGKN